MKEHCVKCIPVLKDKGKSYLCLTAYYTQTPCKREDNYLPLHPCLKISTTQSKDTVFLVIK